MIDTCTVLKAINNIIDRGLLLVLKCMNECYVLLSYIEMCLHSSFSPSIEEIKQWSESFDRLMSSVCKYHTYLIHFLL